jgi:glutamate/tyrosine decarboxylase-like PLP-dependent enzyme
MRELLADFLDRALRYIDSRDSRRVAPSVEAVGRLALLDEPLPEHPTDPRTVLRMLDEIGSPATVASAGGRYFGFVTGGALPAALAANLMAGVWDQNAGYRVQSPVAARVEDVCLKWLREVLGLPAGAGGGFVTGATMANFAALAAARRAVLLKAGWNVEEDGLIGAPPIRVVVGDEVHASVLKALSLLGLGRARVGTCWCGGTMWQGRAAMRISVSSWATTEDDVERSLDAIIRIASMS